MSAELHNPWRTFIENCITGDNYFRASEYRDLLADLDRGYAAIATLESQPAPEQPGASVDATLYRSACDSVEEWKARALEAEHALERIRLDESPTFMGEPVIPEQPAAQGWRCEQCGELADPMSSAWRWAGDRWQHYHGQVGHVDARHFGRPAAQGDDARTDAIDYASYRIRYYTEAIDPECTCETCPQCSLLPAECSGTACAQTCDCTPCDHCKNTNALAALQRQPADADRVWSVVDRLLANAYSRGANDEPLDMLAARNTFLAAIDSARAEGGGS